MDVVLQKLEVIEKKVDALFDILFYPVFTVLLMYSGMFLLGAFGSDIAFQEQVLNRSRIALDVSSALILATDGPLPHIVSQDHILNQSLLDSLGPRLDEFGLRSLSVGPVKIGKPDYFVYRLVLNGSRPHLLRVGVG